MNNCRLSELAELLIAHLARIPLFLILVLFAATGLGIGIFMFVKPALTIELQRRFYAKINWKIEPISISRELRNTRIMGAVLVSLSLATAIFASSGP